MKQMKPEEKEQLFAEALKRAYAGGWKELDLEGKKKLISIKAKTKDLYWTKWGMELLAEVTGTTITFNVSYNDILLSPYFAKALIGEDKVDYKLAGSYVYEWETYLHNMVVENPENRFEMLKAWIYPDEEDLEVSD